VGYETAARIAREANLSGKSVRELILIDKVLTPEQLDKILDPFEMTSPGIAGTHEEAGPGSGGRSRIRQLPTPGSRRTRTCRGA